MSRTLLQLFAASVLLVRPEIMTAQERSYDESALRLDAKFGDVRIVRGADGAIVGQIGVFRGADVAKIVAGSPNAVSEARAFERNYRPGMIVLGVGLMSLGASVGVSHIQGVDRGITTGLTVATFALITYGGSRLQTAYNALARSIWWYNRDLKD